MPKVITVLGGGSVWTPHLLQELADLPLSADIQIRLQGPTESYLHEVMAFTRALVGDRLDLRVTACLEEAISAATIILNQARIGGWSARLTDEVLPVRFGAIGDESLGLGGLRAAMRTWPFVVQASSMILKYAPDAWLLNLTNPSDLVSRAWRKAGCRRVLSLCDHPQTLLREIAMLAEIPEMAFRFGFMGMTHVGWLTPPPDVQLDHLLRKRPELAPWLQEWNALPTLWRVHLSAPNDLLLRQRQCPGHRARELNELAELLRELIRKQDAEQYRALLLKRSPVWYSEIVAPAIGSLLGGEPSRLIVGLPNKGRLPEMGPDVQVESWAIVKDDGVYPEPFAENTLCQEDISRFGRTRDLAFAAVIDPSPRSLEIYARSDAFVCHGSCQIDWPELLDLNAPKLVRDFG